MDDLKKVYREGETGAKEGWRDADGTDVKDEIGNAGDKVRRDLGNMGDDMRRANREEEPHPEEEQRGNV
jgi:hypothetical protein